MSRFATLLLLLILTSPAAALAGDPPAVAAQGVARLSGTWRLVETRQVMADGAVRPDPDLGPRPAGYMMYDAATGRVCTVFDDTTRPRWAAARPTDTEARTMFNQTVAYCGRYRVDEARRIITFDLEVSMSPNSAGTSRERRFELSGDRLTLYPRPLPAGVTDWSVRLERVRR
jgi:hypothetical protein